MDSKIFTSCKSLHAILSFDKGENNKEKSYLKWGNYCYAYGIFWEGLLVYWQMKTWTKFYFVFLSFCLHFFKTLCLEVESANLFKRGAVDMPRLSCTQVNSLTSSWLCGCFRAVFFVPLIFTQFFFSVIHQFLMMITDLFEKGIKKNGSKECLLFCQYGSSMENRMIYILLYRKPLYHVMIWAFSP